LDVVSDVELSGQALEVTLTAKNTGAVASPVGLGWMPIFQLLNGDRPSTMLVVPSRERAAEDAKTGRPLGRSESVAGTDQDFGSADGTPIGTKSINSTYVNLQRAVMADGPSLEIRDPKAGYGLRIIPLSDTVTALHVVSPKDKNWVKVVVETNQADPFGHEWGTPGNAGMKILQPGESVKLRVRVEIFAVSPLSPLSTSK
jgi:galactose mutarotase-like enzyme